MERKTRHNRQCGIFGEVLSNLSRNVRRQRHTHTHAHTLTDIDTDSKSTQIDVY